MCRDNGVTYTFKVEPRDTSIQLCKNSKFMMQEKVFIPCKSVYSLWFCQSTLANVTLLYVSWKSFIKRSFICWCWSLFFHLPFTIRLRHIPRNWVKDSPLILQRQSIQCIQYCGCALTPLYTQMHAILIFIHNLQTAPVTCYQHSLEKWSSSIQNKTASVITSGSVFMQGGYTHIVTTSQHHDFVIGTRPGNEQTGNR